MEEIMKLKLTLAVAALLTIGLSSAAAYADTVTFTLTNTIEAINGYTGGSATYDVTATAPGSNGAAVFLNGNSFNAGVPLSLDDSDFFADAPFFLNPGQSDTFAVFTITVPAATTLRDYFGDFTFLGGSNGSSSATLGTVNFTTAVTPEPGSLLLLATGVAGLGTTLRRRLISVRR
jgi:PEP-CTERM motif